MSNTISPLRGWMLDLSVALDAHSPGFAGAYLRSSDERRQVIAAYCARHLKDDTALGQAAEFLTKARHQEILQKAFVDVPAGLRRALGKAGAQPHDRSFYSTLHRFLTAPRHPRLPNAIQQMTSLDLCRLRILSLLPEDICAPNVVEAIGDVSTAKDVVRLIGMIVEKGVDRAALGRAILSVSDKGQLARLWDRWAARCPLPKSPVKPSSCYRAIETGEELLRMARRYRNCAARYLPEALEGVSSFGEIPARDGHPGVVVHLRRRAGDWQIDGLFLKNNGRPNPDQRAEIYDLLHSLGVKRCEQEKLPEGEWSTLRRLTLRPFWNFDDD